jgi:uncharacterized protein (TIGR00369 family)
MDTLSYWQAASRWPGGAWLFSRLVCLRAPYFSSIRPRIESLDRSQCRVVIAKRRAVTNHIGTVHAIAMCNMAELAGGLLTEVMVPAATHRWIPKGMNVEYLKKAESDLRAIARPERAPRLAEGEDVPILVEVFDTKQTLVFRARIQMWVAPKRAAADA